MVEWCAKCKHWGAWVPNSPYTSISDKYSTLKRRYCFDPFPRSEKSEHLLYSLTSTFYGGQSRGKPPICCGHGNVDFFFTDTSSIAKFYQTFFWLAFLFIYIFCLHIFAHFIFIILLLALFFILLFQLSSILYDIEIFELHSWWILVYRAKLQMYYFLHYRFLVSELKLLALNVIRNCWWI